MSEPAPALEALLFDLDGTLLALENRHRSRGASGAQPGVAATVAGTLAVTDWARRAWVYTETPLNYGILFAERLGLARPLFPAVRVARRWKGIASEGSSRLIDGCEEALLSLSKRFRIGLVTSRSGVTAREILARHRLDAIVPVVVSRSDVWRLKPHPAGIRRAMERLGVVPDRTAMIGDMPVDVRAAKRAGVWAIGVASGLGSERELLAAGADVVLASVGELSAWLGSDRSTVRGAATPERAGA